MPTEKIKLIKNGTESASTRLEMKSTEGNVEKDPYPRSVTPPGPRWYLDFNSALLFSLSLPKTQNVQLKWKIRSYNTKYRLVINDTQGVEQHQRDAGGVDTPYTDCSWDISEYVRTGDNFIKLLTTGGDTMLSVNELSVEWADLPTYQGGNITLDDIEVSQTIQNMDHNVTLIENKKTFARLYFTVPDSIVEGTLTGEIAIKTGAETFYAYSANSLDTTKANQGGRLADKRGNLAHSLNFVLPESACAGATEISLQRLYIAIGEEESSVDFWTADSRSVTFQQTPPLRLHVIGMQFKNAQNQIVQPGDDDYNLMQSWLRRAFPAGTVNFTKTIIHAHANVTIPLAAKRHWALMQVAAIRNLDMANSDIDRRTHYYGLVKLLSDQDFMIGYVQKVPEKANPNVVGVGPTGDPALFTVDDEGGVSQDTDKSFGDWYSAHEIAHSFGRKHVNSGKNEGGADAQYPYTVGSGGGKIGDQAHPFVGLDVGDKELNVPAQALPYGSWYDIMSYTKPQWMSKYTYEGIRNRMLVEETLGKDGKQDNDESEVVFKDDSFVNVIGVFLGNNNYRIEYVNPVSGAFVPKATGNFHKLRTYITNDTPGIAEDTRTRTVDTIVDNKLEWQYDVFNTMLKLDLQDHEKVTKIELRPNTGSELLTTFTVPEMATSIDSVSIPATSTNGIKTVMWTSTGGNPVFNVQIHRDENSKWETIAVGLTEKSIAIATDQFDNLAQTKLRIMATNGIESIFSKTSSLG